MKDRKAGINMNDKTRFPNAVNPGTDTGFPYYVRHADGESFLPGGIGFGVFHWHEDLQFLYVTAGKVCIKTLNGEELLFQGEGVFVNRNVIHYSIGRSKACRYTLFRFPEYFVSFYLGSPAEQMTRRVTENPNIDLIPLRDAEPWCRDALLALRALNDLEEGDASGAEKDANRVEKDALYPYSVLVNLSLLWQSILKNTEIPERIPDDMTTLRMKIFLQYIESHYGEDVTLTDLARSANVSKSEALRCFRQTLQTTPYRYLMDYRISKAGELLLETELPIGRIADLTGFRQQSYFGKCFKERMGAAPGAYRAKNSAPLPAPG